MTTSKAAPQYDDSHWMRLALKLAAKAAAQDEVPVGAVLLLNNRIISKSFNKKEQWKTPIGHAEVICLHRASQTLGRWRLSDATLYVTLEPCVMCAGALAWAQLGKLVYGASDEKRGFMIHGKLLLHPRTKLEMGILSEECSEVMTQFFKTKR